MRPDGNIEHHKAGHSNQHGGVAQHRLDQGNAHKAGVAVDGAKAQYPPLLRRLFPKAKLDQDHIEDVGAHQRRTGNEHYLYGGPAAGLRRQNINHNSRAYHIHQQL